jgi:four helix bundle protein
MFDFQKLEIYKKAKTFHLECKAIIQEQKLESYSRDQLSRASFSVPLNIAEGSGKFSKADRRNYFTTARASVFECVAIIDILVEEGKISKENASDLFNRADELSRMLNSMITNLSQ